MKKQFLYKKLMNRSVSMTLVRCWYLGERRGLAKMTENTMYFEPLFIYKPNKGVAIYFDISDLKQHTDLLRQYIVKNKKRFYILANEYQVDCKKIKQLIFKQDEINFKTVYKLVVRSWPMLTASVIIGAMDEKELDKKIIDKAYELRTFSDKVLYDAEEYLAQSAAKLVPPSYKKYIQFLLPEEVIKNQLPEIGELKNRKLGFIYFKNRLWTNSDLSSFLLSNSIVMADEALGNDDNIVKGFPAQIGVVRGRACVVFETKQFTKVKINCILVTPMTTPDFLPAMKKAAAFVTDEGGVTCHAAIAARELKKPCIIGTKNATSVIKDGDWLEVDATQGIVKILKRG